MAKSDFTGELLHFHVVRMRAIGTGNLQLHLHSLDDIHNARLTDIAMIPATNREPTILANFTDQAGQLELKTVEMGEVFTVSRIMIYIKPVASGYPQ